MAKNDDKLKDLENYLVNTQKSSNLDKLSKRLSVLIEYYKGVSNKDNADEHKISVRTINRWVIRYEKGDRYTIVSDEYKGRTPKMEKKQMDRVEKALKENPLKLGLGYSIWNGTLLKRYINDVFNMEVSKIYCDKLLQESKTIYKASNYDAKKNKELVKIIKELITEYENNKNYSIWYFDTYYLGRNVRKEIELKGKGDIKTKSEEIEEMLRGNDRNDYSRYILYAFYTTEKEGDLDYSIENSINKKTFTEIIKESISRRRQELKKGVNLLIVLPSNNIFKTIIKEEKLSDDIQVKVLFLPKNLQRLNKINIVWDKIERNYFNIEGKNSNKIKDEFESFIDKVFW